MYDNHENRQAFMVSTVTSSLYMHVLCKNNYDTIMKIVNILETGDELYCLYTCKCCTEV